VFVDPVPGSAGDLADHDAEPGVIDLGCATALRAHQVVVVRTSAGDVCVLAGWQVEAFQRTQGL
jgi:hypothetical protein